MRLADLPEAVVRRVVMKSISERKRKEEEMLALCDFMESSSDEESSCGDEGGA